MVRFVKVEYTGKIKDTDQVFDTTQKDVAEKEKLNTNKRFFGAMPFVLGENMLIKGFEKALNSMKIGEHKIIEVLPEEGYGARRPELVRIVPLSVFKNSQEKPHPGMLVVLDNNVPARVQSVSGGRVRLDFNHDLAGKTLIFEVKLISEALTEEEKARNIFEQIFLGFEASKLKLKIDGKNVTVSIPKDVSALPDLQQRKLALIENLKKYLKFETVKFEEEY